MTTLHGALAYCNETHVYSYDSVVNTQIDNITIVRECTPETAANLPNLLLPITVIFSILLVGTVALMVLVRDNKLKALGIITSTLLITILLRITSFVINRTDPSLTNLVQIIDRGYTVGVIILPLLIVGTLIYFVMSIFQKSGEDLEDQMEEENFNKKRR